MIFECMFVWELYQPFYVNSSKSNQKPSNANHNSKIRRDITRKCFSRHTHTIPQTYGYRFIYACVQRTYVQYTHTIRTHILCTFWLPTPVLLKLKSSQVGHTQCKYHGLSQTMESCWDPRRSRISIFVPK